MRQQSTRLLPNDPRDTLPHVGQGGTIHLGPIPPGFIDEFKDFFPVQSKRSGGPRGPRRDRTIQIYLARVSKSLIRNRCNWHAPSGYGAATRTGCILVADSLISLFPPLKRRVNEGSPQPRGHVEVRKPPAPGVEDARVWDYGTREGELKPRFLLLRSCSSSFFGLVITHQRQTRHPIADALPSQFYSLLLTPSVRPPGPTSCSLQSNRERRSEPGPRVSNLSQTIVKSRLFEHREQINLPATYRWLVY